MKHKMLFAAGIAVGIAGTAALFEKLCGGELREKQEQAEMYHSMYALMNEWLRINRSGKSIGNFLAANGYKTIAVYGMAQAGEELIDELKNSDLVVKYGVDRSRRGEYKGLEILAPEGELPPVDAIIVTPVQYYDEIHNMLRSKIQCSILSLEDVVYNAQSG